MNWIKQDAYLICQKLQNDPFRLRIGNDFLSRGRNVISIIFNPVTKLKIKQMHCVALKEIGPWVPRHTTYSLCITLQWCYNGRDGVSNHQPSDCLLNRLFGRRSKKTSKLRVTGLYVGNSPATGEFPAQRASNAENVSIFDDVIMLLHAH